MASAVNVQTKLALLAIVAFVVGLSSPRANGQEEERSLEASSVTNPVHASEDVQLTLSLGLVATSSSGSFPALIFPNADLTLPPIPSERAAGTFGGSAVEFVGTIPLGARFGFGFALGTRRSTISFDAVDTADGIDMELQRFRFGIGARYHLVDPVRIVHEMGAMSTVPAFAFGLTVDAFFRIGLPPAGNRLDLVRSPSVDGAPVDGSFESSSPFATEFAFEFGPTAVFGIGRDIDIVASVYYPLVLSDVFSEEVAPGSDLSEQSIPISLGLGYRF